MAHWPGPIRRAQVVVSTQVTPLPEDAELARLEARLRQLEDELAEQEEKLATIRRDHADFLSRYLGIVGVRLAKLDRLAAEIASAIAARDPSSRREQEAERARNRAAESARALGDDTDALAASAEREERGTPDELRALYRKAAKAVHPDLAFDESDRQVREDLMTQVNRAYERGDAEQLQQIMDGWSARPEAIPGDSVGAKLVRAIRAVAAVEIRLAAIADEVAMLARDDLHMLRQEEQLAKSAGRNLLREMAAELDERIEEARLQLAQLQAGQAS